MLVVALAAAGTGTPLLAQSPPPGSEPPGAAAPFPTGGDPSLPDGPTEMNGSPPPVQAGIEEMASAPVPTPRPDPRDGTGALSPPLTAYAPVPTRDQLAIGAGEIRLAATLTQESPEIGRGLVWRVFGQQPGEDGRLPLVASSQGGSTVFQLDPGSYLIHAAFGRAGATKRVTVGGQPQAEMLVLDAGGLKLDALLSGGVRIPASKLRFSIYEAETDARGERALIIPNVSPNTVVRLNAGTYHVVSTYGAVNAVIRSDIRVEAGKLTEATVEHRAAELTMKLVREAGGEAIADTSWSVVADSGDIVRESVGAFASMVLAEGEYTIVAKNRDRIYQRDFTVVAGRNQDVEVMAQDGTLVGGTPAN